MEKEIKKEKILIWEYKNKIWSNYLNGKGKELNRYTKERKYFLIKSIFI